MGIQSNFTSASADGSIDAAAAPLIWSAARHALRGKVTAEDYERWLDPLRLIAEIDGDILIAAPDKLTFDRVNSNHKRLLQRVWRAEDPKGRAVRLSCWPAAESELKQMFGDPWAAAPADCAPELEPQTGLAAMVFDTLVEGPSNAAAAQLARRIAAGEQLPSPVVLINGPQGVGKTHILHALAQEVAARGDRTTAYMSAEEFMSAFVEGAINRNTTALKARVRSCDLLLIDDVQSIAGKAGTEKEFFATLRAAAARKATVVLTADASPGDLNGLSPRTRADLRGAVSVAVGEPDEAMRREIVRVHSDLVGRLNPASAFVLTDELQERIVRRVRGPGRYLCGAIWSLYIESRFGELAPTTDMLDAVVRRQEGERPVYTIDDVKRATMAVFGLSRTQIVSKSRERAVVYPRQLAMYMCRQVTTKSYPQIARGFAKKDHTTCIYACTKIAKMLDDPGLAEGVQADIDRIAAALEENRAQ